MSDDYIATELNWDDPSSLVDLTPPPDGKKHFGHLRMYQVEVTKHWETGKSFSIPGVVGGNKQEKDAAGNMLFKSYTKGGDQHLYILVATKESQTGEPYQMVKQLPDRRYRKGDRLDFNDVVMPSLIANFSEAQLNKLTSTGIYAAWDDVPTGDKFTPQGETKEVEIMTWGNFHPFETKEAMKAAESEFFGQFSPNSATAANVYPEAWQSDIEGMKAYVKQLQNQGQSHKDIAAAAMLDGVDNAREVLSEILNIPPPMVQL